MACQCLSPGSVQHIEMLENTLQHAAKYQAVQNLLARFFNVILKKNNLHVSRWNERFTAH